MFLRFIQHSIPGWAFVSIQLNMQYLAVQEEVNAGLWRNHARFRALRGRKKKSLWSSEGGKEDRDGGGGGGGGTILLTQTELKLVELLATADGSRNERQMEKSLPTCLSSSRSVYGRV